MWQGIRLTKSKPLSHTAWQQLICNEQDHSLDGIEQNHIVDQIVCNIGTRDNVQKITRWYG